MFEESAEDNTAKRSRSGLTSKNDHWDFVFAGHGVSGKDEYLIVCRNSGTYLSSTSELATPYAYLCPYSRLTGTSQRTSKTELARATPCPLATTASAGTLFLPAVVLGGTGTFAVYVTSATLANATTDRIVPVHDQSMGLALTGGEAKDEVVIKTTTRRNDDRSFAWCLLLTDDAVLNCPDVGKGSF